MVDLDALARSVPDEPRWVDVRGLVGTGRVEVHAEEEDPGGWIVRSLEYPVAVACGEPSPAVVARALEERPERFAILFPEPRDDAEEILPGWGRDDIWLHRYAGSPGGEGPAPEPGIAIAIAGGGEPWPELDTGHLPRRLVAEIAFVRRTDRPAAFVLEQGRLVSLCYATWRTETLWDVSVDTWEPCRRRGLASACFKALRSSLEGAGLVPVWGAHESNAASMAMAKALGFVRDARWACYVSPR